MLRLSPTATYEKPRLTDMPKGLFLSGLASEVSTHRVADRKVTHREVTDREVVSRQVIDHQVTDHGCSTSLGSQHHQSKGPVVSTYPAQSRISHWRDYSQRILRRLRP